MRARIIGIVAAAFLALGVAPAPAAGETEGMDSVCIDVTVMVSPPGWSASFPYPCACGPFVTHQPIYGGAVYTINSSCVTHTPTP